MKAPILQTKLQKNLQIKNKKKKIKRFIEQKVRNNRKTNFVK